MAKDSLFYYTSNEVLKNWLITNKGKIWATRTITSNDDTDTTFVLDYYDILKKHILDSIDKFDQFSYEEIEEIFDEAQLIARISKYINMRTLKDLILLNIENNPIDFSERLKKYKNICDISDRDKKEFAISHIFDFTNLDLKKIRQIFEIDDKDTIDKSILRRAIDVSHPYCICFTKSENDKRMWYEYTKNVGVCLELNKSELIEKTHDKALISDINYIDPEHVLSSIASTKDLFIQMFIAFNEKKKENDNWNMYSEFVYFLGCFVKSNEWIKDNECRVVVGETSILSKHGLRVKENYKLKHKPNLKTQDYIEVDIPQVLVKSIRRGPNNTEEMFQKCFDCNDNEFEERYHIPIYSSK